MSLTYAETALFRILDGLQIAAPALVCGNRTAALPLELEKRGIETKTHVFDFHHYRTMRDRYNAAGVSPVGRLFCAPHVPEGAFKIAFFQTTPQSMPAELVLDQLQEIYLALEDGATLYAAFEGDGDDALKALKKVFAKSGPVPVPPPPGLSKVEEREFKRFLRHVTLFRCVKKGELAKKRDFAAEWEASVPGGRAVKFTSFPGCFAHRRADTGGLALAEIAAREIAAMDGPVKLLDMGSGAGTVGILATSRHGFSEGDRVTFIDAHARAIEATELNAKAAGLEGFFDTRLSDDGTPRGDVGGYNIFVGNPPYYSEYKIAETFISTAYRALDKGGICLTVVKTATALKALQEKYFGKCEIVPRRGYAVLKSVKT